MKEGYHSQPDVMSEEDENSKKEENKKIGWFDKYCEKCGRRVDKKTAPQHFGKYSCSDEHAVAYVKEVEEMRKKCRKGKCRSKKGVAGAVKVVRLRNRRACSFQFHDGSVFWSPGANSTSIS